MDRAPEATWINIPVSIPNGGAVKVFRFAYAIRKNSVIRQFPQRWQRRKKHEHAWNTYGSIGWENQLICLLTFFSFLNSKIMSYNPRENWMKKKYAHNLWNLSVKKAHKYARELVFEPKWRNMKRLRMNCSRLKVAKENQNQLKYGQRVISTASEKL